MNFEGGISLIGSGNVAWYLAQCFNNIGVKVNCIISRTESNARELAKHINTEYSTSLDDIPSDSDLILLCVSDGAISQITKTINAHNQPIAHVAGSVPLSVFGNNFSHAGVFYPFQTFTKGIVIEDANFPICIEANSTEMKSRLNKLAAKISKTVIEMNSEDRKKLHLAGVIANNFTNFLYTQANDYLNTSGIRNDLLLPIIHQTTRKLGHASSVDLQTGPAVRGSVEVINDHLSMLNSHKELKQIYEILTNKIMDYYNKDEE